MTDLKQKISKLINSDDVVLFMKGTPDFPQCGFSANVVGILNYFGIKFSSFNVLEDNDLREGVKEFSDWPTIPQIYINNEFIGGCDILREMLENNGTNHAEVSVELKNDGNNDKKFAPVERIESEAKEEEFVETASQESPGGQKGDLGRYDFLV